ncbi:MFS transporter [Celerinatantimonas sp. MCCC 1A17872]|uniref:MFS transporter n=1 Tax=Celerinatantimonas sp. MCCC 1A17872 TaxID=3177514 RepID=UPI0038C4CD6D
MFRTKYRYYVALLLFFAGVLNYMDRSALSIMAPLIKGDLKITDSQLGILFSCFFIGYCLFCFIGGWGADKYGPKRVYGWAMAVWSLFCGATALVGGFFHLVIVRVLFGIGEGPMGTTTNKSISNWFPKKEVGRAVGFTNAGQPLGAALSAPIVGFVGLYCGWRISFIVIALLGFVWLGAWLLFFKDKPEIHNKVSEEEAALIVNSRPAKETCQKAQTGHDSMWRYILSMPVIGVALAFFCFNYIQYFFLSWLPIYLVDFQHLDIKSMSIVGMLPWLGATVGFIAGGAICDYIFGKLNNFVLSRKIIIFVGLGIAAISVFATAYVSSLYMAVTCITIATIFAYMTPQACWSLLQDIVPPEKIGTTGGFVHLLSNLAGIMSPAVTGFIIQYGGGYHSAFILASILAVGGMIALFLLVKSRAPMPLAAS